MKQVLLAAASLLFALLVGFFVVRLARAKTNEVGEAEVSRRISQGYRVRAATSAALVLGGGVGYLGGMALGEPEVASS